MCIWPKGNCSINGTSQNLQCVDGQSGGERSTTLWGWNGKKPRGERGDAAGDAGEHLCGPGLVGAAGGNELQPRKERDLGGSSRLRFLSNCRFGF